MNAKTGVQEPQRPSKRQVNTRLESEDWWIAAIEQEMKRIHVFSNASGSNQPEQVH